SALLTPRDIAAHTRNAVATVQKWTRVPDHPLKWFNIPGGFLRTTVGYLKQFLAGAKPRPSLMPLSAPKPKLKAKAGRRDPLDAPLMINRRRPSCREKRDGRLAGRPKE